MRRFLTLGLIASTALSLALPAMAAPGDGRGRVARQDGNARLRPSSGDEQRGQRAAPPAQRAAPVAQRPAERSAPPPSAVQNTRVPPSAVSNQQRGQQQRVQPQQGRRIGTGDARVTNWPDQRRIQPDQRGDRNDAARRPNQPPAAGTARPANPGNATGNRWQNGARPDTDRARNDRRDDNGRWQNGGRTDGNRWNNNDRRGNDSVRNNDRGSNWNRNNWNGRRLADRERWSEYRRWDNQSWRRDNRYDWQRYRTANRNVYHMPRYYAPSGWNYGYRRFSIGIFLSNMLYANNYWIDDPYYYRLPPAYGYLRWVRYYDDAILVDIRDGYVVDVIHNFFW